MAFNTYGTPGVNFNISGDGINLDRYNGFANPGTDDTIYNNLLQVAIFNWNNPTAMTLNWENMTVGNTYLVEFWLNNVILRHGNAIIRGAYGGICRFCLSTIAGRKSALSQITAARTVRLDVIHAG